MLGYRLLLTIGGASFWACLGWYAWALDPAVNFAMAALLAVTLWALGGLISGPLRLTDPPDAEPGQPAS